MPEQPRLKTSGCSTFARCAAPGRTTSSAAGIDSASESPVSGGVDDVLAPAITSVGARIAPMLVRASQPAIASQHAA